MKNITLTLIITLLLSSCGGNKNQSVEDVIAGNDLEKIRTKRAEVALKQQEFEEQLKQLDTKISSLDTVKHVPLITTFKAKETPFNHYLELQGNVTTKNLLVLYPEFSGILSRVYVKEGQKVSKGQLLAKIDDGGLSQQKAQLQINADLAKTTFERQERLWKQSIGSEIQYLQAKSNYEAQAKAINQLDQQLAKTTVRAPFSGTIDDIMTEQGSVVGAGQTQIMRIVNLNDMYIETEVPERYINNVTKNKKVNVELPVIGKTIESKIRQTADYINPSNRTFKIEVAVPNKDKDIKPNLTAKLKINDYTNENAYLIPQSIISENANGEQYVYVVKDINDKNEGIAEKVIIETGRTQGDIIEVLKGLENGTEIIQEGARSVKNGQAVKILENTNQAKDSIQ
ncbi:efflux RND transporter periplasmic adaptor subunit [Aureibaculum sp. 2210JD6-5]|uniref:efflux RND transporter periplasmic adaptor subunit n=1 Tax=Aureibaculum sp. 2210JD6-5 TaxID=3103957 RepID=UPI002AAF0863|nr:efflux RND transporter periplasmic adaptor subunit [Aureibaculum sp. 2210JD6-5]MDY7395997.1 efflux RND transporter periplasmic adaptor subunit [Aureibaculum sp. 2210JD6-5]